MLVVKFHNSIAHDCQYSSVFIFSQGHCRDPDKELLKEKAASYLSAGNEGKTLEHTNLLLRDNSHIK